LLDRALLHHEAIRYRAHALNAALDLDLDALSSQTRELSIGTRQRLSKSFTRLRKSLGADTSAPRRELQDIIHGILRERDQT
jgi:hypothetical protein